METFLAAARTLVAIDVFAMAITIAILVPVASIFAAAYYIGRWRKRVRLISPYATSAPFLEPERFSRT